MWYLNWYSCPSIYGLISHWYWFYIHLGSLDRIKCMSVTEPETARLKHRIIQARLCTQKASNSFTPLQSMIDKSFSDKRVLCLWFFSLSTVFVLLPAQYKHFPSATACQRSLHLITSANKYSAHWRQTCWGPWCQGCRWDYRCRGWGVSCCATVWNHKNKQSRKNQKKEFGFPSH